MLLLSNQFTDVTTIYSPQSNMSQLMMLDIC